MYIRIKQLAALALAQVFIVGSCAASENDQPQGSQASRDPAATSAAAEPDAMVSRLRQALRQCDEEVLRTTNTLVYRSGAAEELIELVASAWRSSRCAHNVRARAFLAEVLAQAYANGIADGIDVQSLRVALRRGIESNDAETSSASIFGLASIAEPEDFRNLEALARSKVSSAREDVVRALAMQCSEEPTTILRRLETEFAAWHIDQIREDMEPIRKARCQSNRGN